VKVKKKEEEMMKKMRCSFKSVLISLVVSIIYTLFLIALQYYFSHVSYFSKSALESDFQTHSIQVKQFQKESNVRIKYLEYSSHDGFGNQFRSLRNGILLSWLLNRTLVVPPEYSHLEAPVRGNCFSPSDGMIISQSEMIQGLNPFFFCFLI